MACIFGFRMSRTCAVAGSLALAATAAQAGPLRDWIEKRQAARATDTNSAQPAAEVQVWRDQSYGPDPRQRFDVHAPRRKPDAQAMPVIVMVHGGGWAHGDKTNDAVVDHKVAHWVARGAVLVSVNYRMLPDAGPLEQAKDVAAAVAKAQQLASQWGADPNRLVLMGHSAGAHLVALLSAAPQMTSAAGAKPWLGAVLLDSAALNVVNIMRSPRHLRLYDDAFGKDESFWVAASPWHALNSTAPPMLAVCSSRRDDSCQQAQDFVDKARTLGVRAARLPVDLSHRDINETLGQDSDYTRAVDAFLGSLPGFNAPLKPDARP